MIRRTFCTVALLLAWPVMVVKSAAKSAAAVSLVFGAAIIDTWSR